MIEGRPRYASALGATDAPAGWRDGQGTRRRADRRPQRRDDRTRAVDAPFAPLVRRQGSGCWSRARAHSASIDPEPGDTSRSPHCPGSRAGSTSCGRYAFIGLSQVRETAVFSGIPITERLTERTCGVWVVDIAHGPDRGVPEVRGRSSRRSSRCRCFPAGGSPT